MCASRASSDCGWTYTRSSGEFLSPLPARLPFFLLCSYAILFGVAPARASTSVAASFRISSPSTPPNASLVRNVSQIYFSRCVLPRSLLISLLGSTDMSRSFRAQGVKVRIHQGVSTTSPFSTEAILPRRVSGVNKRSQDDESAAASSRAVSPTRSVGSGGGQQDDVRGKRPRTSGSVEQSRPSAATHAVRPTSPLSLLSSQNHSLRRDYPSTADYATRQQAAAFEHYEQSQQQHSHHPVHPAYLMPERRPSTHSGSLPAGSTHAPPSPYHGPSHHRPHPSYPPPYPSHQHPHHAHPYHPSYSQPHLHSSDYPQHFPPKPSEQHTVQADPSVRHEFRNSSVFARSVSHTGGAPSHGVGSRPPYEQSMTSPVGSYPPSGNGGVARKSVVSSATLPPPSRHSPFDQSNRSLDGGPPPLPIAPRHSSRPSSAGFLPSVLGSSSLTSSSSLPPFSHATYYGSHPSSSSSSLAELRTSAEMTDKLPPPYGDDAGLRHHRPGSGGSTFASSSRDSLSSTTSERHSFTSTSADRLSLTSLLSTQSSTPPIPAADHATTARARPEYAVNDRFSLSAMRETDDEDGSSSSRSREVVAAASPMYESSSSRRNSEMGPRDEIRPPAADLRRETPMEGMLASSRSLARMTSSDSRPPLLPPGPEATTTGSAKGKMGLENILS